MRKTRKSVSTKKEISQCKRLKEKQEDFIMLPTVDFCFKELMQNDNIRKNIIAALLNVPASEVENTKNPQKPFTARHPMRIIVA